MVTFVHIADIHVGMGFKNASFSKELANERRREIKETLYRVIDYCENNERDLLLIAGDLFEDDYVSISDLKDMNHRFSCLTKTRVVIGAGNHDPVINQNSCYNLIQWCDRVHLFKAEMSCMVFEDLKTEIHSFSWNKKYLPAFQQSMLLPVESGCYHILMLHGDAYNQGDYLSIKPTELEGYGYDYVALGHIHRKDFLRPWMAYPGSLEPLDFSEEGPHGFIEGSIGETGLVAEFKAFSKRKFSTKFIELTGDMSYEAIKDKVIQVVEAYDEDGLYRIILRGLLDTQVLLNLEELKSYVGDRVHYVEFRDETMPDLDIDRLKKDYQGTLIGAYIDYMDALDEEADIKEEALYKGLRVLLREQVL